MNVKVIALCSGTARI